VGGLGRPESTDRAFNQYGIAGQPEADRANKLRRGNLRRYLRQMGNMGPRAMLVGEAPGYRGCRLTGVPFTSEKIILSGLNVVGAQGACQIFGSERGYQKTDERERVSSEASATMVWGTIAVFQPLPVLWNAYPFHTFHPGRPMSNRRPSAPELAWGGQFVAELLQLFAIETVVAVGASAASALNRAGIRYHLVRHPSHGGKAQFVAGLKRISGETGAFLPVRAERDTRFA
jgi:uracil-DNA glycosylase